MLRGVTAACAFSLGTLYLNIASIIRISAVTETKTKSS